MKKKRQVEKPNWENIEQISLRLNLEESDEEKPGIAPADAARLSEVARQQFGESHKDLAWFARYMEFVTRGWPWRVAAYIAWASVPKLTRHPKTQEELAKQFLGLTSDRVIHTWRKKNPAIDEMVGLMQSAPLFEHRADVFDALVKSATNPDYKHKPDRQLLLELTGDYTPRMQVEDSRNINNDLEQMSDEELRKAAQYAKDHPDGDSDDDSDD